MAKFDLLCLTRCYKRTQTLEQVLRMATKEFAYAGVKPFIVIAPDPRTTPEVRRVVWHFEQAYPEQILLVEPSMPVMSPQHGQRWIQVLNEMCEAFDRTGHTADWVMDMDDDQLFSAGFVNQLRACLDSGYWAWRSVALYLWDEEGTQVNVRQYHWSPTIGRYQLGARRHTKRVIEVPDFVQDAIDEDRNRCATLPFYLLDYGTSCEKDRKLLYREYARAGKLDPYTQKYVTAPLLVPLEKILRDYPDPTSFETWQRNLVTGGACA